MMKRITKIISKIMLFAAISIILILFGFYVWLNLRIDHIIDKETYNHLVKEINASEDLPERFYKMYGIITKFDEKSTTNKYLFNRVLNKRNYHENNPCPCADVGYGVVFNSLDKWTVGLALDKDVSPKKCLDFSLSRFDFLYNTQGIKSASKFYYHKELSQLSDEEMLELSTMTINPSYYNKIRRPEKLREMIEKVKIDKNIDETTSR